MTTKAKESLHVQKARKKIEEQLKLAEKKMNPEALSAMGRLIKEQIHRQQPGRINLKQRQVISVDNNRYAKTESKFILKMINQIKQKQLKPEGNLEGRIKPFPETNQPSGNK
ncbi:MAG TPA: hypothetical protein VGP47_03480 [Parachlamydiaceae bacterium]|nr:hypothetical protein [Parachlamydiaceae bacterium]